MQVYCVWSVFKQAIKKEIVMVADAGLRSQLGPGADPLSDKPGWDEVWEKPVQRAHGRSQVLEKGNNETCLGHKIIMQ